MKLKPGLGPLAPSGQEMERVYSPGPTRGLYCKRVISRDNHFMQELTPTPGQDAVVDRDGPVEWQCDYVTQCITTQWHNIHIFELLE